MIGPMNLNARDQQQNFMILVVPIKKFLGPENGSNLQGVLASGLDEDSREQLGARFHPEPLLGLLALAGEADNAGGAVNEAADEQAL